MGLFFVVLFIAVPIAELFVIIQVGQAIGVAPTIGLMLLTAVIGAALLRSQGRQAWQRFRGALSQGKVPAREVFDGAMIIFGGALLLTPGFITDVVGITLLLPPGRAVVRRITRSAAARTPSGRPVFFVYDRFPGGGSRRRADPSSSGTGPRPDPGPGPSAPRRPARSYDVEGSAQEIGSEGEALPDGRRQPGAERSEGDD